MQRIGVVRPPVTSPSRARRIETMSETQQGRGPESDDDRSKEMERRMYLRFAAMIVTGMFVMYWTMFVGSYRWRCSAGC
jgi:hypothetical protein